MANKYYAEISWEKNTPKSALYDDVYYSVASGIEESNYVFIQHNQLKERFSSLKANDIFIIAETGFGSGLNFLNVLELWQYTVKCSAKLFFISFEKHPLSPADLKIINANLPNFAELEKQYYLPLEATHRLSFNHNVYLNLVIGDVNQTLKQQSFEADAWFLDGFTPSRNNDMWTDAVIKNIARLCKKNATFATYTANSAVRKTLQNIGFVINKSKGFNKRDMLYGSWPGNLIITEKLLRPKPWFARYENGKLSENNCSAITINPYLKGNNANSKVIIIGGGISGAATAYSLAKRGYQVTLYEQSAELSSAASGNYQAMLYGSFSSHKSNILELSYSGYRYSHYLIQQLLNVNTAEYANCGLIQLGFNPQEIKSQTDLLNSAITEDFCRLVNKQQIQQLSGIEVNYDSGLYFPYGLWLNPQTLVQRLLKAPNIKVILNQKIDEIEHDKVWYIIQDGKRIDSAANVVLCNADSVNQFNVTKNLSIRKIRGQISIIQSDIASTGKSFSNQQEDKNIKTILCGPAYVTPKRVDKYTIGATFDFKNIHTEVTITDHIQNLTNIQSISSSFKNINPNILTGHAAIRASSYDYMPLVGPIAKYLEFKTNYSKLAQDKNTWIETKCPYLPGLYLNVAHGSKGILTAPICGEIVTDYIDKTPMPCSENVRIALHPNRLYIRELVKG